METWSEDYINNPAARTAERNAEILRVHRRLFGIGFSPGCGRCHVKALIKILKFQKMANCDYKLKPGVFRQGFGLPPLCAWTLTNELAEEYLKFPENRKLFAVIPEKPVKKTPVKVEKEEKEVKEDDPMEIVEKAISEVKKPGRKPKK